MATLSDARAALRRFAEFRHPDRPALDAGDLYALTPTAAARVCWPAVWPHADRPGVYLILDASQEVLYVGKASMSSRLYMRLEDYFGGGQGPCRVKHAGWTSPPQFVVTVAVPRDSAWEAAGLEEFLIRELQPVDNIRGRLRIKPPDTTQQPTDAPNGADG